MNQEYERLQKLIGEAESKARQRSDEDVRYRNGFHIMPPTGWLNDPNGLCQLGDEYHLFFQYSPLDARGGMKAWGHYVTKDFVTFKYEGAPFVPDEDFDKNGVYSGSAYIDEDGMHIFYTGNVKLPGDYDYVNAGRRADTVLVESKDGKSFSAKKVVIDTDEYPKGYSCHIRDPKVWKEDNAYYMVLGARTYDSAGDILIYKSLDMIEWSLYKTVASKNPFGYMWECPDIFALDDEYVISFSPQGLDAEEFRYQNTYQSGYVLEKDNPLVKEDDMPRYISECIKNHEADKQNKVSASDNKCVVIDENNFIEWDMGFDFYAPQTFMDNSGRRILVGWAGMPDPGYENGETDAENWQHCFTVPRVLTVKEGCDGVRKVFQTPIKEIEKLRNGSVSTIDMSYSEDEGRMPRLFETDSECLDIVCDDISGGFTVMLACEAEQSSGEGTDASDEENTITGGVAFSYDGEEINLILTDKCGLKRELRSAKINSVSSLRILVDNSIAEFYINDGEMVFTTRYYKEHRGSSLCFDMPDAKVTVYEMSRIKIR